MQTCSSMLVHSLVLGSRADASAAAYLEALGLV